jgi:hypothetical protein
MAAVLPSPEQQFVDPNGAPYAGGTLATLIPGTLTGKTTWSDIAGGVPNANPIVLDSAGRAVLFGDGEYRLVLKDALGNLIWDQESSTLVSAAMAPVVSAADLPTARQAMGVTDAIATALTTATANTTTVVATETAARIAADTAETTARTAEDTALQAAISAETSRAIAAEAALAAVPISGVKAGAATTDATGHIRVTYPTAYSAGTASVALQLISPGGYGQAQLSVVWDSSGFDAYSVYPGSGSPVGNAAFGWISYGS